MSLLHDALKKSETEQGMDNGQDAVPKAGFSDQGSSLRVYFLALLVVAAGAGFAYMKYFRGNTTTMGGGQSQVAAQSVATQQASVDQLMLEGSMKLETGDVEGARKNFEKVVILSPRNDEAYNNLGLALKKLNRNDEAFEQYRKALAINEKCSECLNNLGVLYMANRELTEAESNFQKAIQTKPTYADPYFHLAMLMEARGDLSGAKKNYLKFIELGKGVSADFLLKVQNRIAALQSP